MDDFLSRVRNVMDSTTRPARHGRCRDHHLFHCHCPYGADGPRHVRHRRIRMGLLRNLFPIRPTRDSALHDKHFSSKFWGWLDGLIVFSFYRAVSAGFAYIWLNVMIGFFDNTVAGDYSIGHWLAILATLIMLTGAFVYGLFRIPMITSMLFGGVGSAAAGYSEAFLGTVAGFAEKALLVAAA